jgi:hypothetical protein
MELVRQYVSLNLQRERFVKNGSADGVVLMTAPESDGLREDAELIKALRSRLALPE